MVIAMEHHNIDAISLTYLNPRWNTRVGRLRPGNDRNNDAFNGSLLEQDISNDPNALLELAATNGITSSGASSFSNILDVGKKPIFPIEIWANILAHADDYTVWATCRKVSRMLRDEAEREFRTTRLDKLKVHWTFWSCTDEGRARYGTSFETEHELQTGAMKRLSDDMSLVYYSLEITNEYWDLSDDVDTIFNHSINQTPFIKEGLLDCVGYSENTYLKQLGHFCNRDVGDMKQKPSAISVGLKGSSGSYLGSSDIPWREVDLRNREISIDWKRLLDDALGDKHVFVQCWD